MGGGTSAPASGRGLHPGTRRLVLRLRLTRAEFARLASAYGRNLGTVTKRVSLAALYRLLTDRTDWMSFPREYRDALVAGMLRVLAPAGEACSAEEAALPFVTLSRFIHFACRFCLLSERQLRQLAFHIIDTDGDGIVSVPELVRGIGVFYGDEAMMWAHAAQQGEFVALLRQRGLQAGVEATPGYRGLGRKDERGVTTYSNVVVASGMLVREALRLHRGRVAFGDFNGLGVRFPFLFYRVTAAQQCAIQGTMGAGWWRARREMLVRAGRQNARQAAYKPGGRRRAAAAVLIDTASQQSAAQWVGWRRRLRRFLRFAQHAAWEGETVDTLGVVAGRRQLAVPDAQPVTDGRERGAAWAAARGGRSAGAAARGGRSAGADLSDLARLDLDSDSDSGASLGAAEYAGGGAAAAAADSVQPLLASARSTATPPRARDRVTDHAAARSHGPVRVSQSPGRASPPPPLVPLLRAPVVGGAALVRVVSVDDEEVDQVQELPRAAQVSVRGGSGGVRGSSGTGGKGGTGAYGGSGGSGGHGGSGDSGGRREASRAGGLGAAHAPAGWLIKDPSGAVRGPLSAAALLREWAVGSVGAGTMARRAGEELPFARLSVLAADPFVMLQAEARAAEAAAAGGGATVPETPSGAPSPGQSRGSTGAAATASADSAGATARAAGEEEEGCDWLELDLAHPFAAKYGGKYLRELLAAEGGPRSARRGGGVHSAAPTARTDGTVEPEEGRLERMRREALASLPTHLPMLVLPPPSAAAAAGKPPPPPPAAPVRLDGYDRRTLATGLFAPGRTVRASAAGGAGGGARYLRTSGQRTGVTLAEADGW